MYNNSNYTRAVPACMHVYFRLYEGTKGEIYENTSGMAYQSVLHIRLLRYLKITENRYRKKNTDISVFFLDCILPNFMQICLFYLI